MNHLVNHRLSKKQQMRWRGLTICSKFAPSYSMALSQMVTGSRIRDSGNPRHSPQVSASMISSAPRLVEMYTFGGIQSTA
jgi:hypothetical protein